MIIYGLRNGSDSSDNEIQPERLCSPLCIAEKNLIYITQLWSYIRTRHFLQLCFIENGSIKADPDYIKRFDSID